MIVGVVKEIKADEYRTALLPAGVAALVEDGHTVLVEQDAGLASGFDDHEYEQAGAKVIDDGADVWKQSDLVVKVKEPQPAEVEMIRDGQVVFCFFHFAANVDLLHKCLTRNVTTVAYETLSDERGRLSLLTPMSEIAGRMSVQAGAKCLEKFAGGKGILLGGPTGVMPAKVVILGGGVVGSNAARTAAGLGADVVIMDINLERLRYLDEVMAANVRTVYCDRDTVERFAVEADLLIGAVLLPGRRSPVLVTRELVGRMQPGSVIVDVCVDQGGCIETSRPTTHHEPTYVVDEVVHYGVANIPGIVPRTSSPALCNATGPYVRQLALLGADGFAKLDTGHAAAINTKDKHIVNEALKETVGEI